MAFEYELPDVGEGVAEGELVAWHVSPGDRVEEDDVLAEVETDKAVVDLPAPVTGTILELHAEEGDVVPVGDVVVTLEVEGEGGEVAEPEGEAAAETGSEAEATTDTTAEPAAGATDGESEPEPATADAAAEGAGAAGDGEATATAGGAEGGRVFAPPKVRRLAREMNVDITAVDGTGPGGRITEQDVREAAGAGGVDDETVESAIESVDDGESGSDAAAGDGPKSAIKKASESSAVEGIEAADRERTLAAPATRKIAREEGVDIDAVPTDKTRDGEAFVEPEDVRAFVEAQATAAAEPAVEPAAAPPETTDATAGELVAVEQDEDVTREPYRGIRRTIGEQMEESAYTAPHVSHHDTAVVDDLVATRTDLKARAEEQGVKLTYLPFVMKAIVAGLKEYPVLNSTLDEEAEEIVHKHYYNIGVAVATDAGLMVPVVENVDEKGLLQLASEANELAARARERDLTPAEMRGGTFTITNFGAIGGEYATPIINYPETGILGLGSLEQRPVVADGEVVAAHTLPLSLSIDHRVIDGAEAAQFTNTVIEYLENPQLLLLE